MRGIDRKRYAAITSIAFLLGDVFISIVWIIGFYFVNHTWTDLTSLHNLKELVVTGIYGGYSFSSAVAGLIWLVGLSKNQSLWSKFFLLILFVLCIKWVFLISFYLAGFVYLYNLLQVLKRQSD